VIGILNAGQRFTYALQGTSGLSSAFTYELKEGRTGCESKMMSTVDLSARKGPYAQTEDRKQVRME